MNPSKQKREPISFSSQPAPLPLGGEVYLVAKHTLGEREQLEQFARDRTPQPLKQLHERARQFDESMYQEIVRAGLAEAMQAQDHWPPRMGSPEFMQVIRDPEGLMYLLWIAFKRFRPDLTLDMIQALLMQNAEDDKFATELGIVLGRFIYGAETKLTAEDLLDPKAKGSEAAPETDYVPDETLSMTGV